MLQDHIRGNRDIHGGGREDIPLCIQQFQGGDLCGLGRHDGIGDGQLRPLYGLGQSGNRNCSVDPGGGHIAADEVRHTGQEGLLDGWRLRHLNHSLRAVGCEGQPPQLPRPQPVVINSLRGRNYLGEQQPRPHKRGVDPHDMPIIAVVDPDMMSSMPKGLTASTGMDALTHAIEGYTTKAAWEMTDMFHLKAIELISKSLRGAVANTKEGREGMALGQYIAGMGFSNVGLGIAHSMAHTLGAVYDTPHGVACAMMLPIVMEYNQECTGEKYREIARAMGVTGVDEMSQEEYRKAAIDAVKKLSADVGIPSVLEAVKEEDLQFLADSAHADACAPGNPKDASVEDLKDLFRKIMA